MTSTYLGMLNINKNSIVDITPLEAYELIEQNYKKLESIYYCVPTELFKIMYYYYLSPKDLLMVKRFNRKLLIVLLDMIININKNKNFFRRYNKRN